MKRPLVPVEDDGAKLDQLLAHERRYLEEARRLARQASDSDEPPVPGDPGIPHPRGELCGLALSGGGMRSAIFNLGLLQCLQQLRLLEMFDYLATVSGGGYIGGFWTAWRHYHPGAPGSPDKVALFPTSPEQGARGARFPEVRHLREFSNFLSPRLGLMGLDAGRMLVAVLSAIIPSLLAAFSFLVLGLLLWLLLAWVLLAGEGAPSGGLRAFSQALMLGVTCGVLFAWEALLVRQDRRVMVNRDRPVGKPEDLQEGEGSRFGYYLNASVLAAGAVFVLWGWFLHFHPSHAQTFHGVWLRADAGDLRWRERLYLFHPAGAWAGAAGALVVLHLLGSRFATAWMQRTERAAVGRVISRLLLLACFWSILSAFWLAGHLLNEFIQMHTQSGMKGLYAPLQTGLTTAVVALSACFAKLQQIFSKQTTRPTNSATNTFLRTHLAPFLAYAILALSLLGAVLLVLRAGDEAWMPWLVLTVLALSVITLLFFDANLVGLHSFYRDRIARTFIGAAHGQGPGQTEPHTLDDFLLDQLRPQPGPLHLMCCAANDLASIDPMANLYRGADSAVLSSVGFSVGPEWKGWEQIRQEGGRVPTLASAMTASAAALNSHMGSMSMRLGRAVTFLMTAFNLRLGLWWPHPTRARRQWYERLCVGLPFYKELLGRSRARGRDVLLSDGGHFENLALYELVRRRCRFILVSDCGMDAESSFDDFANAVRRIREDFGVEIRIELSPLRPDPDTGLSLRTVVAGDIQYPDGSSGVLLLVKPSMLGGEPPDIMQYKARNADFPHETTGDQFYDEAQWESYRRLGEHTALTAFQAVRREMESGRMLEAARLFARARHEWMPVPAGYEERFTSFVERSNELDSQLEGSVARKLFRQIFKELTELERRDVAGRSASPNALSDALENDPTLKPTPQELADALHMIRRALLFMEEVFLTEDLATYYPHPAYRGMMNYFARWGYAPLVRTWWPLLKTLHTPRFTHFLEERFNLVGMEAQDVGRLGGTEEGFAMSCWVAQGGRKPRPYETLLSYSLLLPHGGRPEYPIQAAQLIMRTHQLGDATRPLVWSGDHAPARQVVVWQGDDFYVPPGLWGAGIGEDFLRLITADPGMPKVVTPGSLLAVRLQVNREATAARQKRWADDLHLYRAEGFSEPDPALRQWLAGLEPELDQDSAMPWVKKNDEQWKSFWLTRPYQPVGAEARTRGGVPAEAEGASPLH